MVSDKKQSAQLNEKFSKQASATQEKERLEKLKEVLSRSKTGRQTLDFLEKNKTTIQFESMEDNYGLYYPEKNAIVLNSAHSFEDQVLTVVHEGRHAWQSAQMDLLYPELNPKSIIETVFAIEADACAAEVMFAHEMREKNPEIWAAHQDCHYAPMSSAFEKTLNESGDLTKARADAFEAWYICPPKKKYGDKYVQLLTEGCDEMLPYDPKDIDVRYNFKEDLDAQKIAATLFKDYDGKPFLKDASVIEKKENLCLNEFQAKDLIKGFTPFMEKHHRTPESLGLDKIGVFTLKGTMTDCAAYVTPKEETKTNESNMSRVIMAKMNKSR